MVEKLSNILDSKNSVPEVSQKSNNDSSSYGIIDLSNKEDHSCNKEHDGDKEESDGDLRVINKELNTSFYNAATQLLSSSSKESSNDMMNELVNARH